jgi:hypothetical protein
MIEKKNYIYIYIFEYLDMFDGDNGLSTGHNDHQDNQIGSLISTPDESFYDVMNEEEEEEEETKLTSMSVPGTPAARATN